MSCIFVLTSERWIFDRGCLSFLAFCVYLRNSFKNSTPWKGRGIVRKILLALGAFCALGGILFSTFWEKDERFRVPVLRVYTWAHYLPQDVIRDFEATYGVQVEVDVFESLETLEAKLLAARSGYDIVLPPAWPTVALFIPSGAFLPLDLTQIPNARGIDSSFLKTLAQADPGNRYVLPYLWGTTGLAYDARKLDVLAPEAPRDSWALLFDSRWASQWASARGSLLDSPMDVFPAALLYLGKQGNIQDLKSLQEAADAVFQVRPWISKFDSSQVLQDLISGNVAVAQVFSTYGNMAARHTRDSKTGPRIVYTIPQEGALIWADVMAIPKDAPNRTLAHQFMNFILRPEIMARISNQIQAANSVPASSAFMDPDILKNPGIYPPPETLEKLLADQLPDRGYERIRLRLWTQIKTGYYVKSLPNAFKKEDPL
jgi:putrescine transport system substrate-binding protein